MMNNNKLEINQLNLDIINSHYSHYTTRPTGLVNLTESPNGNLIYHLYSTGEISFQKGGNAYMMRSEFMTDGKLPNYQKLALNFPHKAVDGSTYVILTEDQCKLYRIKMIELIQKLI